ncbi:MAG: tripartite tricarboxylate transporter substrate binding protein [Burkholderiales bacterium]|nr:tripartite tricarboxylate transporter substrate binding protein [Burkholderiales bacterium]
MLGLACALPISLARGADNYPSRALTLVVPYVAGGAVDFLGRLTGPRLAERLGQNVVIENIGGASGTLGAAKVVAARPDGYTLVIGSGSEISVAKLINPNVSYDGERDLAPISLLGSTPQVLVSGTKLTAKTLDELLAAMRASPGKFSYASAGGVGSPSHLAGEAIRLAASLDITHVPYKGAGQVFPDLMGGHIELALMTLTSAMPHIKSGKLKAFGVTSPKRSQEIPNVPALAEHRSLASLADMSVWWGLFAPAKTPAPILQRLNKEFNDVLKEPVVIDKLHAQGITIVGSTPAEFQTFIRADTENYRKIVRSANIQAQ